jgi:hypothetical protein
MAHPKLVALLILGFLLCSLSPAQADSYTATSIDVPGSTCTMAFGINAKGQIVGGYCDDHGVLHSFLLAEEHFSQIEIPGSTKDGALGINARGQVVGDYSDAENVSHGCVWDKGTITTINVPGAFGTSASDIPRWTPQNRPYVDGANPAIGVGAQASEL